MLHVLRDREPNIEVSLARLARQAILIDLSAHCQISDYLQPSVFSLHDAPSYKLDISGLRPLGGYLDRL
jgi:hypothetical protein